MESEVVQVGKRSIETLNSIIELEAKGNVEQASTLLLKLKPDGILFADILNDVIRKQERLKQFFVKAELNSKRDIADCIQRLLEMMELHASMLTDLERNTVLSFHFKSKLDMSMNELGMVNQATKIMTNEGSPRIKRVKDLMPHFLGDGDLRDEIHKKKTRIQSVVEHNKRQCRAAGVVLEAIRRKLNESRKKISFLEHMLGELQRKKDGVHRKLVQVKQSIDFLDSILDLLSLIDLISEDSGDNEDVIKKVVEKATEKIGCSSGSRATRKLASTFLEALESELLQAQKGYSQVLSCGFLCEGCNTIRSTDPQVHKDMLLCTECYESHNTNPSIK